MPPMVGDRKNLLQTKNFFEAPGEFVYRLDVVVDRPNFLSIMSEINIGRNELSVFLQDVTDLAEFFGLVSPSIFEHA